MNRYN